MRLICDDNLGKLAKYLRILGFDTSFQEPISDAELMRLAAAEQRFLLTRDHHLQQYSHPYGLLVLEDDDPLKQLTTVINSLNLSIDPALLFLRCSRCNAIIEPVDKTRVRNQIFPYILKTQKEISRCPSCGRFYWKGTHYSRLLRKLRKAIPDQALTGAWPGD
jgi:uncharacterized protein with PIN domain